MKGVTRIHAGRQVLVRANCGHLSMFVQTNAYGYSWCSRCGDEDVILGLEYCSRVCGVIVGQTVRSNWGLFIGPVTDNTKGIRTTPTGGIYQSHKITVLDTFTQIKWYANVKQETDAIILRRADR